MWVTTNNSPSQDYNNPDNQRTPNIDKPGSKLTTSLLRTTPTRTIHQLQTSTHLGHNQKQPLSGLHQPGRFTNYKSLQTLNHLGHNQQQSFSGLHQPLELINQPITNTDSPGSQPTTALLRTTPTPTINQLQILTLLCHNQQQSFSGLHQHGQSANYKHRFTWVTTINSPSQNYANPDNQRTPNTDKPGSKLTTSPLRTTPTRTISHLQTLNSPGSQPRTVLRRTTPTRTISDLQTLTHLGHKKQQSFSGLNQPGRSNNYRHWLTCDITNNNPSPDHTDPDDQPTTNTDSPVSHSTTVLLRTTLIQTISQLQTSTHLGYNQQQSFSGHTKPDDQPATNIDSPGSQPTRVLLRTTPPGRSANYNHGFTWVTTNDIPS